MSILKEQLFRVKELMGILNEDVATTKLPNLKATNGLLSIDGKRYKLVKETFLKNITITIHNVIVDKDGSVSLDASAMGLPRQTNIVGKDNIDKVIEAVKRGDKTIAVQNKGGTEFTLTKV
tara:strand:- start:826 stop:1188 length:363 start_codon:yes stop_codon:yes gene_type:complete